MKTLGFALAATFLFASSFLNAQTAGLSFRPVGAVYSSALDRIIMISGNPSQLHVYNPVSNADQVVALPEPPQNISLSADGLYAAVALTDSVSYVNLQSASVQQTYANAVTSSSNIAVATPGYVFVLPSYVGVTTTINLATGLVTTPQYGFNYTSAAAFNSATSKIYSTEDGISPNNLYNFPVSSGMVGNQVSAPYFGVFNVCGPVFFSPDGSKIYTGCGSIYAASSDSTKDMRYLGAFNDSLFSARSMAFASSLNRIAVIPSVSTYPTNPTADGVVNLYDSSYYGPVGQFQTNPFTVGSHTFMAHGRWVFYNSSSTNMFVITQADATAALTLDFAIDTIKLQNVNSCDATFASSSAAAIAPGSYGVTQILSPEDCVYSAVSNVAWISLTSGYYGSGNTALNYLVRPNLSSASRSGTLSIGSNTFTVTQAGAGAASSFVPLSYNPVAADYDKVLDAIVFVSANPNELHLYNPVTLSDQIVELPNTPLSVSVRPDGQFAGVGHKGGLSYVNLQNFTSQFIPADMDIGGILLAGNGYVYAFPVQTNAFTTWYSIDIANGALSGLQDIYDGNVPRLSSDGNFIYVANGIGVSKYNISGGPAVSVSSPGIDNGGGNNIWLSEDGSRLINNAGHAFFTSSIASQDLQPDGSLSSGSSVAWAANSQVQHQTAILTSPSEVNTSPNNTQLQLYNDVGLQLISQEAMPAFSYAGSSYPSSGQYVFWNKAETKLFAVTSASPTASIPSYFAVNQISAPESIPACSYSVSPTSISVPPTTGLGSTWNFNVVSACTWTAVASDPSWLLAGFYVDSFPVTGNATVAFQIIGTNTGPQRSQTISIGNQNVNVTQAAASCTYALSTTNAILPAAGGIANVDLITQAGCPWSAQSNSAWLSLGSSSGSGSGRISYSAVASSSGQNGSANIAGIELYVEQEALTSSSALNFVPVTPCRIADTRGPAGSFGAPFLSGGVARSIPVPSSACNIPSNAAAYSLNATVVPHGILGYLTTWPTGQTQPLVSTLNSIDGRIKANAAVVQAGTNGEVSFYATNDTDLVLDIDGYFVPATTNTGLEFYTLTPCRVADTRNPVGLFGGPSLSPFVERDFPVQQSACSVPANAQAYSTNVTAVPYSPIGALSMWPTGESQPVVSTLNAPTGAITANAAILSAGTNGDINVLVSNPSHVVLDINGYFAPASSAGLHLYTLPPCRILDTRQFNNPAPVGNVVVPMGSNCSVPANASAVVINATVVPATPLGALSLWPDGQAQPLVSTLNSSDGAITSNMAIVPMTDGAINAFVSNPSHLVVDVSGYFAP